MKEEKKIPMLPLWIADGLMFVAVFITAVPSLRNGEPMGLGQTLLCCALVAAAMGMLLFAYKLNYNLELKAKENDEQQEKKNIDIIFEELAALRLMLADSNEKIENLEFSAADAKQNAEKIALFENGVSQLRDSAVKKFKELSESVESLAKRADDISAKNCAVLKKDLADFNVEFLELKENLAKTEADAKREISSLNERVEILQEGLDAIEQSANAESEAQLEASAEDIEGGAKPEELSGVLNRALSRGDDVGKTVEKFVNLKSAEADVLEPESKVTTEGGEKIDDFKEILENITDPQADKIPGDDADIPAEKKEEKTFDGGVMKAQGDNEDFFNSADSATKGNAPEFAKENALTSSKQDTLTSKSETPTDAQADQKSFLFGEMPLSWPKKPKPTKHDAVIEVNALIGIGNKPFLRANVAGLSLEKGVPMEFVEIGKWRYVFVEVSNPIEFKILKNDEDAPNEEVPETISAGEKLELNLSFPQREKAY